MKDGPHNKACPFVVWTGAQYLGIPRTILHFSTTDVDGFFIKTSRHNQFLINIFFIYFYRMQIKHFRMGKLVIQDDNSQFYSVKVYDHKTKKSYGPAILTIPRDLYVAIERYIAAFREDVDEDDSVFEKKSLKGAVKIFNDFIKDLDLSETVFQPKDFRHMVSTWGANHQDEHVRQHVAEVQSHSQDVAEDYYDHNKQEMAAKIARQKSKDLGIGHSMPINETQAEINKRNEFVEAQKVQNEADRDAKYAAISRARSKTKGKGCVYDPEDRKYFVELFKGKDSVTIAELKKRALKDPKLRRIIDSAMENKGITESRAFQSMKDSFRAYIRNTKK